MRYFFSIRRHNNRMHTCSDAFSVFGMATALRYKNKALAFENSGDVARGMELRHMATRASQAPVIQFSLRVPDDLQSKVRELPEGF